MSEETIKRRSKSKLEILCYVTSAVMLAAALFMTVTNIIYIVNYMSAYGYGFTDMWMDIISTIITGFASYFTYSVLTFCAAKAIAYINVGKETVTEEAEEEKTE